MMGWYFIWGLVVSLVVGASTLINPQAVGCCCFMLVFIGCLVFGYWGSVWLSHFIFLSFLGGLLVIFLYAVALAPSPLFVGVWGSVKFPLKVAGLGIVFWYPVWKYNGWGCYSSALFSGYYEVPPFSSSEFLSSGWVGGASFVGLAVLLAVCMISVTKLCSVNKAGSLRGVRSAMSS